MTPNVAAPVFLEPKEAVSQIILLKFYAQYFATYFAFLFFICQIQIDRVSVKLRVQPTVAALGFEIQWSGEQLAFSLGNLEWERG